MSALEILRARLEELRGPRERAAGYHVPGLWVEPVSRSRDLVAIDPIDWWRDALDRIAGEDRRPPLVRRDEDWSRDAVVYGLFVRTTAAFDHDADGRITLLNEDGFRETGTFLKAITLLPYIRSLGCNTVHLLPITAIGSDGRKGSLGSPYAIRNPYRLDESLAEPALGLGAEVEFAAFVEAAHRLGLRVVVEFVLRTAAKDSDWVGEHPEWFYWIRADVLFGSPRFAENELRAIKDRVARGEWSRLPPPPDAYRSLYVRPEALTDVEWDGDRWVGRTADGASARIPGAFADWPPDDAQPAWSDVTYLRMYDHPEFDYMAYNTLRMYDARLARPENAVDSLWERIAGVISHHQERFGIDGALIDMGHALPRDLKARVIHRARALDAGFAFWGEEFRPSAETKSEGYNAVVGNFWWSTHRPEVLRNEALPGLSGHGTILPFFAAPETHNTPRSAARAGGLVHSRFAWALGCSLPAIPFVQSGFELGEIVPINTGLDFDPADVKRYPADVLPLYSPHALDWTRRSTLIDFVRQVLGVRRDWVRIITDPRPRTLRILETSGGVGMAILREGRNGCLVYVGNPVPEDSIAVAVELPWTVGVVRDLLSGRAFGCEGKTVRLRLAPGDSVFLVPAEARSHETDRPGAASTGYSAPTMPAR